jgi:hypothetical protein
MCSGCYREMGCLNLAKGSIQARGLTNWKKYDIIASANKTIQNECVESLRERSFL